MIQAEQVSLPADLLPGESVVALYFDDQKPLEGPAALLDWRLDGQLTRMLLDREVKGRAGEHVMLQGNGKFKAEWVLFVGGGKWYGLSEETHAALIRHMLSVARQAGFRDISLAFASHAEIGPEQICRQVQDALAAEGEGLEACRYSCDASVVA